MVAERQKSYFLDQVSSLLIVNFLDLYPNILISLFSFFVDKRFVMSIPTGTRRLVCRRIKNEIHYETQMFTVHRQTFTHCEDVGGWHENAMLEWRRAVDHS